MRALAHRLAIVFLALAALASAPSTHAQPYGRERRVERREGREERRAYRPPIYGPAPVARPRAYAYPPGYAYPGPRPGPVAPPVYAPAPPPGYAPRPNSLGEGWGQQQGEARRGVAQGGLQSLRQVIPNIRRAMPGRMLDAGLEPGPGGRPVYRVRWAAVGGRRIDYIVDAQTGAIIGQNGY
jgi:hypothetical protein